MVWHGPLGPPMWLGGESLPADAGEAGDAGSIPGWGKPLEEGVAPCRSTLAWEVPWTEEPGGLQSTGSQGVRHS